LAFLVGLVLFLMIFNLFWIRLALPVELDDVTPEISCSNQLLKNSDILWVIPRFNGNSIADNPQWCDKIKALNKTLGLHGVYHSFEEFNTDRTFGYLDQGLEDFERCFGYSPKIFKSPQLKISKNNEDLMAISQMQISGMMDQIIHKVYHCSDGGFFSNRVIALI